MSLLYDYVHDQMYLFERDLIIGRYTTLGVL
jgi:hypothetical protein